MLESQFKLKTIDAIKEKFSDIDLDFIKPKEFDRSYPDVFIIGPGVWAALEFKQSEKSARRPNQEWHIARLNEKGYATFVFPENLEEVMNDLEKLFTP